MLGRLRRVYDQHVEVGQRDLARRAPPPVAADQLVLAVLAPKGLHGFELLQLLRVEEHAPVFLALHQLVQGQLDDAAGHCRRLWRGGVQARHAQLRRHARRGDHRHRRLEQLVRHRTERALRQRARRRCRPRLACLRSLKATCCAACPVVWTSQASSLAALALLLRLAGRTLLSSRTSRVTLVSAVMAASRAGFLVTTSSKPTLNAVISSSATESGTVAVVTESSM